MHRAAVVGVVVLLACSGCSGLVGSPTVAPGVAEDRLRDASTLAAAHQDVLKNTSHTFTRNACQRLDGDGFRYALDHETGVTVAADGDFRYRQRAVIETDNGTSRRLEGVWSNGSVAVRRTVDLDDETVTYTRYRPPEPFTAANVTRSGVTSAVEAATVVETWNDSGARYARIASNESESRRIQAGNGSVVNATSTREATAIVREDGFVGRAEWTVTGQRPLPPSVGPDRAVGRVTHTTRIGYTDVGSTDVARPDWVDDGIGATDDLGFGTSTEPRPAS